MFIAVPPLPRAQTNPMPNDSRPRFTPRQGQYLAFIHAYTLVIGRPPAEADMQRFFRVSGPAVHQMVVGLEKSGLISRQPGAPRSIQLLVGREALPELRSDHEQPVRTSVQGY
jgi:Mn-dependent DtxR family transcriptional regulator